MAIKVKLNLNLPSRFFSAADTLVLASDTLAMIKLRTSEGLDADRIPFREYSTNAIYISKRGARLQPKGGRESRTGQSVYYAGGYQEYKHESRRRDSGDSAEVDLVLSGNMMNNLVVKKATRNTFTIGLTDHAQYGYYVNEQREFLGLSAQDVDTLVESVKLNLKKALQ
jgi:hypothetical protein